MLKSTHVPDLSAREVAPILAALQAGTDPGKLTQELASRYPDNSGTARRLVDIALAYLWLAEGAPAGDVLTMLECRHRFEFSSAACRVYALEILWAAEREIHAHELDPNPAPKELQNAAA